MKNKLSITLAVLSACSVLALFLAGCASAPSAPQQGEASRDPSDRWIKGNMTRLEDGVVYSFRIQKKLAFGGSATGGVAAIHPSGGPRLAGQYTGMMASGHANSWAQASAWGSGGWATAQGSGYTRWQSETANAQATLTDDQGLAIQIRMLIKAGLMPHGMGEGLDNQGRHYQITF